MGRGSPLVFPSVGGKPIGSTAMSDLLRALGIAAVPHGFRSSFRDWAAEETAILTRWRRRRWRTRVRNQIEAAYRRSDLFERRRIQLDDWAAYLAQGTAKDSKPSGGEAHWAKGGSFQRQELWGTGTATA